MGGEPKLLRLFHEKPLVRWMAETLVDTGLRPVMVVLGHEPGRLAQALSGLPVQFVENPRYLEGMGTSLSAGVAALGQDTSTVVVALGDMPLLSPQVVVALVGALALSEKTIVVPTYDGRRGHPVVFNLTRHRSSLLSLSGDQGARALLAAAPEEVLELAVPDPGVLWDADTPEDLERLEREHFAGRLTRAAQ